MNRDLKVNIHCVYKGSCGFVIKKTPATAHSCFHLLG
nr:MAG TPA: hypothetical protein [Caudoviricetes sp.]